MWDQVHFIVLYSLFTMVTVLATIHVQVVLVAI